MTARGAPVIRSLLYVAAAQIVIAKVHERGADAIILDLEDAVVPAEKPSARMRKPRRVGGERAPARRARFRAHQFRTRASAPRCRSGAPRRRIRSFRLQGA